MRTWHALGSLALSSLLLAPAVGHGAAPPPPSADSPSVISMYLRDPGSPASRELARRSNVRLVDLDKEKLDDAVRTDVQYGTAMRYRGLPLSLLISLYQAPLGVDLAILHFDNGVAIPVPFRDDREMKRLDAFVARSVQTDGDAPVTSDFPPLLRRIDAYVDVRPVEFHGNKLAVATRAHPMVPQSDAEAFSPWMVAGSLRAIEFVQQAAYYRQIDVAPEVRDARDGLQVFLRTCQFCHGVAGLGARFGIDFVEPEPVTARKATPRSLFFHVMLRDKAAAGPGSLMPALRHLSEDDVRRLHRYLTLLGQKPLLPYKP